VTKVAAVTTETIAAVLRPVTLVAVGKRLTAAGEFPLFKFDPRILAGGESHRAVHAARSVTGGFDIRRQ